MAETTARSKSDQTHDAKTKARGRKATTEKDKQTLKRDRDAQLSAAGDKRANAVRTADQEHRATVKKIWASFHEGMAKLRAKTKDPA